MTFTYTEPMMIECLKANGWCTGWDDKNWVPPGANADYCDFKLERAFAMLLTSKNLYGKQFDGGWK